MTNTSRSTNAILLRLQQCIEAIYCIFSIYMTASLQGRTCQHNYAIIWFAYKMATDLAFVTISTLIINFKKDLEEAYNIIDDTLQALMFGVYLPLWIWSCFLINPGCIRAKDIGAILIFIAWALESLKWMHRWRLLIIRTFCSEEVTLRRYSLFPLEPLMSPPRYYMHV